MELYVGLRGYSRASRSKCKDNDFVPSLTEEAIDRHRQTNIWGFYYLLGSTLCVGGAPG